MPLSRARTGYSLSEFSPRHPGHREAVGPDESYLFKRLELPFRESTRDHILTPFSAKYFAAPGCSEHHTGRAIDIGSPGNEALEEDFALTPAFRWLEQHAGNHGFILTYPQGASHGIGYEPWHWCFIS